MSSRWRHSRPRPPWWPDNEQWPPRRGSGRHPWGRRAFLFRMAMVFAPALYFGAFGLTRLLTAAAEQLGIVLPRAAAGLIVVALLFGMVPLLFLSGMRRVGVPLGDIVSAADRVGGGDYSVRLIERGPRFLQTVARAFNSMTTRLDVQEQQRRHLMADIAHELRTPLAIMRGRVEGIIDGVYAPDDATLKQLLDDSTLLERLIEDLGTLSHAEAGTLQLQREATDMPVLLHEVARTFTATAQSSGVTIDVSISNEIPLIEVDSLRVRQVVVNLVTNALRYTPRGGQVRIQARAANGLIVIEVEDTGPGIPPDDLPRIFRRFAKGSDSQGSGLGLAIARRLVMAHGGEISAANRPAGGTTVSFSLPIEHTPASTESLD